MRISLCAILQLVAGISCGSQVNLNTGGQVQTDFSGQVCEQHGKQRTHNVYDGKDGHYWQVQATTQAFCLTASTQLRILGRAG